MSRRPRVNPDHPVRAAYPDRKDVRPMDKTFVWLDGQEDWFFEAYLASGSLRKTFEKARDRSQQETGYSLAHETLYRWLAHDIRPGGDERRERWQHAKELRGYISADEASEIADNSEQATANRDRLRWQAKTYNAEWQHRNVFGRQPASVQIAVGIGNQWEAALREAVAHELPAVEAKLLPPGDDD